MQARLRGYHKQTAWLALSLGALGHNGESSLTFMSVNREQSNPGLELGGGGLLPHWVKVKNLREPPLLYAIGGLTCTALPNQNGI